MTNKPDLSPHEALIVELAIQGFTNEGISAKLHLSADSLNTHWLRIRMKLGELGRSDAASTVIAERAEKALREANVDLENLTDHVAKTEHSLLELRASVALLHLALEQIISAVWATDKDLKLAIIANGALPKSHLGVVWEVGKTVYEIFKSTDPKSPPIAAHLGALKGKETTLRLDGEFSQMIMRALPLRDEAQEIMGTIGIMNYVGE